MHVFIQEQFYKRDAMATVMEGLKYTSAVLFHVLNQLNFMCISHWNEQKQQHRKNKVLNKM